MEHDEFAKPISSLKTLASMIIEGKELFNKSRVLGWLEWQVMPKYLQHKRCFGIWIYPNDK